MAQIVDYDELLRRQKAKEKEEQNKQARNSRIEKDRTKRYAKQLKEKYADKFLIKSDADLKAYINLMDLFYKRAEDAYGHLPKHELLGKEARQSMKKYKSHDKIFKKFMKSLDKAANKAKAKGKPFDAVSYWEVIWHETYMYLYEQEWEFEIKPELKDPNHLLTPQILYNLDEKNNFKKWMPDRIINLLPKAEIKKAQEVNKTLFKTKLNYGE